MTQALFAQWRGMCGGKAINTVAKMMADRDEEEDASATAARLMQFAGVPRQADLQAHRGYGGLSIPNVAASSSRSGNALAMAANAGAALLEAVDGGAGLRGTLAGDASGRQRPHWASDGALAARPSTLR